VADAGSAWEVGCGVTDAGALLVRLARAITEYPAAKPLTWRLCVGCRNVLGADGASITVDSTSAHRVTVCSTNALAARLEDLQDVTGEGPSLEAFRSGATVVADLGEPGLLWPTFGDAARELAHDVVLYAIPMRPGDQTLGVISLLRKVPGALTESLDAAQLLADMVGAALLADPLAIGDYGEAGTWSERDSVHQATGMVVAQLGITPEDALALLKAHAFSTSSSLAAVAGDVLTRRLDFRSAHDA